MKKRCDWVQEGIHQKYHDREWGVPLHRDRKLFEFLLLDGAQAGLSWITILKRRSAYRKVFDNFNPEKISMYKKRDINSILKDDGIVRNRKKVESFVNNARRFLEVKDEFKTFDEYIWQFVDYKTKVNKFKTWSEIPPASSESKMMSKNLMSRGFTFVGPTICYAFMQSVGMVNDHTVNCFRHKEVQKK
ncbi:DNA-3-methyladenine glycosylase I [Candidatus Nitrosarchaeum limnium]|uniref:DNA-3-methyladenine glycosylase I n=1 Tax=Candidatus Nitrosarchaeum limnium TaxID=1007084 RepID=UPI00026CE38B|nr:DNA-3-methyladenine glycosylase I [Candidatus Nitrosarchaeum limnium]